MGPKYKRGQKRSRPSTPPPNLSTATEAPKSLDDSDEKNVEQTEELKLKHIHFPPQSMSDVEIRYGDYVFYCHRVVLARKSKVFEAKFSKTGETTKRLTYPEQKTVNESSVSSRSFLCFLLCFYYPFDSLASITFALAQENIDYNTEYHQPIELMHLFHYFQFSDIEADFINYIQFSVQSEESSAFNYQCLLAAVNYRIPRAKKMIIQEIASFYSVSIDDNEQFQIDIEKYGKKLSSSTLHRLHVERMNYLICSDDEE